MFNILPVVGNRLGTPRDIHHDCSFVRPGILGIPHLRLVVLVGMVGEALFRDVERDWGLDYDTEPATMTEIDQRLTGIQNKSLHQNKKGLY